MPRIVEVPDLNDLIERYQAGEPEYKLASEAGIGRNVLRNRLLKAGVEPRGGREALLLRWQNAGAAERDAMLAPAHEGARGSVRTGGQLARRAAAVESSPARVTADERRLGDALVQAGLTITHQKAAGPYNLDIAVHEPAIAVELFGGGWHAYGRHKARFLPRAEYVLDQGWALVVIWSVGRFKLNPGLCADYIHAFAERLGGQPAQGREYRVILGHGERAPVSQNRFNSRAVVDRLRASTD